MNRYLTVTDFMNMIYGTIRSFTHFRFYELTISIKPYLQTQKPIKVHGKTELSLLYAINIPLI